jgi:hypothetical protein
MTNGKLINSKSATLVLQVNHLPIDCNLQSKKGVSHRIPTACLLALQLAMFPRVCRLNCNVTSLGDDKIAAPQQLGVMLQRPWRRRTHI